MQPNKSPAVSAHHSVVMPWSVKGVSDEARAIAKMKAGECGQTIGAWLTDVIMQQGAGSVVSSTRPTVGMQPAAHGTQNNTAQQNQAISELTRLLLALAKRVAVLEGDTVEFAASFQDQLSDIRRKVQVIQEGPSYMAASRAPNNPLPMRTIVAP
jgi:hypothetical protein